MQHRSCWLITGIYWGYIMLTESRATVREKILVEEIAGAFRLDAAGEHFEFTQLSDVSVSGVGLVLSAPLQVGSNIDLTFVAGDWSIGVDGKVIWCSLDVGDVDSTDTYRLGIKLNPANSNNNVIFFMASKSMVRSVE